MPSPPVRQEPRLCAERGRGHKAQGPPGGDRSPAAPQCLRCFLSSLAWKLSGASQLCLCLFSLLLHFQPLRLAASSYQSPACPPHCACSCLSCCSLGTSPSLFPRRRAEPPALGAAPRAGRGAELLGLVLSKAGAAGGRGTGTGRARCRRSAGSSHGCASKCGVLLAHPGSRGAPRPDSGLLAGWMLALCLPQPLQGEKSTRAGTGTGGCLRRAP